MGGSRVNHIVLIQFKPGSTDEQIQSSMKMLGDVKYVMEGFESMTHGPYSSSEGWTKGYDYGFTMVFSSEAARDVYLAHPAHEAAKTFILQYVDDVICFDYLVL
jgi:hypothetical protein